MTLRIRFSETENRKMSGLKIDHIKIFLHNLEMLFLQLYRIESYFLIMLFFLFVACLLFSLFFPEI